jgi:hypothetical protein
MSANLVTDYHGQPLHEGFRVEGWYDGVRFTARVKEIRPHDPASPDYRHVILVRDNDLAEVQSFSDAVVVIGERSGEK